MNILVVEVGAPFRPVNNSGSWIAEKKKEREVKKKKRFLKKRRVSRETDF
jgi:hypothetical protein